MAFWEGYIGTLYENYSEKEIEKINPQVFNINKKLEKIFTFKTLKELKKYCRNLLTEHEINYINSPIYDNILQSINEQDPLFFACKRGASKIVIFYLTLDAKEKCDLEESLLVAIEKGHLSIIKTLLNNGAEIMGNFIGYIKEASAKNTELADYFNFLGYK